MKSMQKKKTGGFLNRYDFAYAGRDAVNQACKVAPGVIKGTTKEIDNILNVELITSFHKQAKKLNVFYQKCSRELLRMNIRRHFDYLETLEKSNSTS